MALFKINGTDIPAPAIGGYGWEVEDISSEDSGMMLDGTTWKDIIRRRRKLNLKFPPLNDTDASTLLNLVESGVYFDLTYPDPKDGTVTKTFYVGNRKTKLEIWKNNEGLWEGLAFNVVEK